MLCQFLFCCLSPCLKQKYNLDPSVEWLSVKGLLQQSCVEQEVRETQKLFLKPFGKRMTPEIVSELYQMKLDLVQAHRQLDNYTNKFVIKKHLHVIVNLVCTSLSQILESDIRKICGSRPTKRPQTAMVGMIVMNKDFGKYTRDRSLKTGADCSYFSQQTHF